MTSKDDKKGISLSVAEQRKLTPDSEYLKSDEIGTVISKGMAVMYRANPKNPVDFLAKWLLNHAQVGRAAEGEKKSQKEVKKHEKSYQKRLHKLEENRKQDEATAAERQAKIDKFAASVEKQHDLNDMLQDMTSYLKEFTESTAVYIGKLCFPKKPVEDGDDDRAHENEEAEAIIHYCHASEGHDYIINKELRKGQGITFDVFNGPKVEENAEAEPVQDENSEQKTQTEAKEAVEKLPFNILVEEVVRNPRIHYFKVPRLGSFMAIHLEYDSCLHEEAFDDGVKDMLSVHKRRAEQEDEKADWEKDEQMRKEQKEQDEEASEYKPEERDWPTIEAAGYIKKKVQFVVCMNTCGQDRQFTEDEKKFALRTVQFYRDRWEKLEEENLTSDIMGKCDSGEEDRLYKEHQEAMDLQELEQRCEAQLVNEQEDEPLNEEAKAFQLKKHRFKLLTCTFYDPAGAAKHKRLVEKDRQRASQNFGSEKKSGTNNDKVEEEEAAKEEKYYPIAPEQWKEAVLQLRNYNVIKFPRVLQSVLYLLGFKREDICEDGTNKLCFKKVRTIIGDETFYQKMAEYKYAGSKTGDFRAYEKVAFLKKNLDVEEEQLESYSQTMFKLWQWCSLAIELRCEDVVQRRDNIEELKNAREVAINQANERKEKLDSAMTEAQAQFEAKIEEDLAKKAADQGEDEEDEGAQDDRPDFPLDEFMTEFNTTHPEIEIPDVVKDDVDNDYDLPYTPPTFE